MMIGRKLSISPEDRHGIWKALLPDGPALEHAAFAFAKQVPVGAGFEFHVMEWFAVETGSFAHQHSHYIELTDELRARVIKRAHDLEASIVEFHSHVGDAPASFSRSDKRGLEEWIPHVWWRLKGRPYVAVVVTSTGFDSLIWRKSPDAPEQLEAFQVGEKTLWPTKHSLPFWQAHSARYDRNVRFFGVDGQIHLRKTRIAVVGAGGIGLAAIQGIAILGAAEISVIDDEVVTKSNLGRYVGIGPIDVKNKLPKVNAAERLIESTDPSIVVRKVKAPLLSEQAFDAIKGSDVVFGCLDNEGGRLVLNEFCSAYEIPYIDAASDIITEPTLVYGGRVFINWSGNGCFYCCGLIDIAEAQVDLASPHDRANRKAIYGVDRAILGNVGPSVGPLNAVIAGLATHEYMLAVTGVRAPRRHLVFRGDLDRLTESVDVPRPDCFYCKLVRGQREKANVERYLSAGLSRAS